MLMAVTVVLNCGRCAPIARNNHGNELVYRTVIVNVLAALAYSEQELGLSGVVHCHGRPQRALVIAVDIG